jgi:hypothetical protein
MNEETRKQFHLYLEKMHVLMDHPFVQKIMSNGIKITVDGVGDTITNINTQEPQRMATDAFVLTFRLFDQRRDGLSFEALEELTTRDQLSPKWNSEIVRVRNDLDALLGEELFLSLHMPIEMWAREEQFTHKHVFEVIFYGEYAHVNEKWRPEFEKWRDNPLLFSFLRQDFLWTMFHWLQYIKHIGNLMEEELSQ